MNVGFAGGQTQVCASFIVHRRICVCPYLSSSAQHAFLGLFARWEVSGWRTVFLRVASMICSEQHTTSLWSSHLVFSSNVSLVIAVQLYSRTNTARTWKHSFLIWSERYDFHMVDNLSIAVYKLPISLLISFSVRYYCRLIWSNLLLFIEHSIFTDIAKYIIYIYIYIYDVTVQDCTLATTLLDYWDYSDISLVSLFNSISTYIYIYIYQN